MKTSLATTSQAVLLAAALLGPLPANIAEASDHSSPRKTHAETLPEASREQIDANALKALFEGKKIRVPQIAKSERWIGICQEVGAKPEDEPNIRELSVTVQVEVKGAHKDGSLILAKRHFVDGTELETDPDLRGFTYSTEKTTAIARQSKIVILREGTTLAGFPFLIAYEKKSVTKLTPFTRKPENSKPAEHSNSYCLYNLHPSGYQNEGKPETKAGLNKFSR